MDYFRNAEDFIMHSEAIVSLMRKLAEPLLKSTNISNFSYLKFFDDGNVLNLTTDIEWIKYRFKEKIKYQILFQSELDNIKLNNPYIYLWPNSDSKVLEALHHYGIWNGCNIYLHCSTSIEVFSFASSKKILKCKIFMLIILIF